MQFAFHTVCIHRLASPSATLAQERFQMGHHFFATIFQIARDHSVSEQVGITCCSYSNRLHAVSAKDKRA